MTGAIRLDRVSKGFASSPVLRDVDLLVGEGERVAVLGRNGAGKTTLVRLIAGLSAPTSGTVRVLGGAPHERAVRRRIGIVLHEPVLYDHLTALENLALWATLYDAPDAGAARLLERLGLDARDRRVVGSFSRGMRRRVTIARALVHDPDLLVLDEPFAGLDEQGEDAAVRLLAERACTMLIATHDAGGTRGLTSRTLTLERGVLAVA